MLLNRFKAVHDKDQEENSNNEIIGRLVSVVSNKNNKIYESQAKGGCGG